LKIFSAKLLNPVFYSLKRIKTTQNLTLNYEI